MVRQSPLPPAVETESHYEAEYWESRETQRSTARTRLLAQRAETIIAWASAELGPRPRVLEVGCGPGDLVALFEERTAWQVDGVEPSPRAAGEADARIRGKVQASPWELASIDQERYDLLVMAHVLEHIHDVSGALAKARTTLRPGGRLYIEVPNMLRPSPRKRLARWLAPEHLWYFTPNRLTDVTEREGFETLRVDSGQALRLLARPIADAPPHTTWSGTNDYWPVLRAVGRHELRYWPSFAMRRLVGR